MTERSGLVMARWFLLTCVLPESKERKEEGRGERKAELITFLGQVSFQEIQLGWFSHDMYVHGKLYGTNAGHVSLFF